MQILNLYVIRTHGKRTAHIACEVEKWGKWIKEKAEEELAEFYPKDEDGATPIAYLWARTITCEGPGCGAEVPLTRSLWLAKKGAITYDQIGNSYLYRAAHSREEVTRAATRSFVQRVFDGALNPFLAYFAESATPEELTRLKRELARLEKEKSSNRDG